MLLCVTPYVPFPGIDHAGGAFLDRYVSAAVAYGWMVRLLAPESPDNRRAASRVSSGAEVLLYDMPHGPARRLLNVARTGVPATTGKRWLTRLPSQAVGWLRDSDVIELQWADSLWNARVVAETFRDIPLVGMAHDVRTQSLARALRSSRGRARLEALVGVRAARGREIDELNRLDLLSVFKREDVDYLVGHGLKAPARVMPVLLPDLSDYPGPDPTSRRILFVGAFHRPENVEAAEWLLDEVIPSIRGAVPDTVVRLAGSRPPSSLLDRVGRGVEVTGYLPSMAEAYADVACVVVPLRRGAGVKFKAVEALLAGFPVVSTTVGAEGVEEAAGRPPLAVQDEADAFAEAVIRVLLSPPDGRDGRPQPPSPALASHFGSLRELVDSRTAP